MCVVAHCPATNITAARPLRSAHDDTHLHMCRFSLSDANPIFALWSATSHRPAVYIPHIQRYTYCESQSHDIVAPRFCKMGERRKHVEYGDIVPLQRWLSATVVRDIISPSPHPTCVRSDEGNMKLLKKAASVPADVHYSTRLWYIVMALSADHVANNYMTYANRVTAAPSCMSTTILPRLQSA